MRFGTLHDWRVISFDTHDWENDDGGGLSRRVNTTEAHDTPFVGEFDNAAHRGGPAIVRGLDGHGSPSPKRYATASETSKPYAGLTVC
jgi:hypothetical protein